MNNNELMGVPNEPNKYLESLLEQIHKDFDEEKVKTLIKTDGLPIFLQRVLISNMSSSTLTKHIINRYGFEDVENDIKWLKELELKKQVENSTDKKLLYLKNELSNLIQGTISKCESTIYNLTSEKNRILVCLSDFEDNDFISKLKTNNTPIKLDKIKIILENELKSIDSCIESEQKSIIELKHQLKEKMNFDGNSSQWIKDNKVLTDKYRNDWNYQKKDRFVNGYSINVDTILTMIEVLKK